MITPVVSELATLAAMAALFWVVVEERHAGRSPFWSLARRWFTLRGTTAGTLIVAIAAGIMLVVLPLTPDIVRGAEREPDPAPLALVLATIVVKLAFIVFEEVTFRGALLDWLRARLGTMQAVLACGLCFGLAHGTLPDTSPGGSPATPLLMMTVVDGLAFAAAAALTDSLWTSVAWHAAKDLAVWQLTSVSLWQFAPGRFAFGEGWAATTLEDVAWAAVVVVLAVPLVWLLAGRGGDRHDTGLGPEFT